MLEIVYILFDTFAMYSTLISPDHLKYMKFATFVKNEPQPNIEKIPGGFSGVGVTFPFWDCCKPSCAWKGNVTTKKGPIATCAIDGVTKIDSETQSGCETDGKAYTCTNQAPWIINSTMAYGFACVSLRGVFEENFCCGCLLLTFHDVKLSKKKMIVQYFHTDNSLYANQINFALPGGNIGENPLGCNSQWNISSNGWGKPYWEIANRTECGLLPNQLQKGCTFRYDWMEGISVNEVTFEQVKCPAEIVTLSCCDLEI